MIHAPDPTVLEWIRWYYWTLCCVHLNMCQKDGLAGIFVAIHHSLYLNPWHIFMTWIFVLHWILSFHQKMPDMCARHHYYVRLCYIIKSYSLTYCMHHRVAQQKLSDFAIHALCWVTLTCACCISHHSLLLVVLSSDWFCSLWYSVVYYFMLFDLFTSV